MVAGATHGVASAHPVAPATRRRWTGSRRRPGPGLGPGGGTPPAPTDERIDRLFERTCDELRRHGRATSNAVETADGPMSYVALETAAVRLARYLRRRRIAAGDRVAVLLERPEDALVAQLAVARIAAVWVPLDARLPDVALAAVLEAAGAGLVLTTTDAAARLDRSDVDAIYLDRVRARVEKEDAQRLTAAERGSVADKPAYVVVHASDRSGGAHGGLRATAVGHEAAAAFLRGAAGLLQIGAQDRVHHDPRAGSDLAVLETWLAWSCGATVVTAPAELLLMREHSMTVPFWDQWDAEARAVYVPYSACGLSWSEMFNLHNEHRVFFTRLLALDLLGVNRQWDPRLPDRHQQHRDACPCPPYPRERCGVVSRARVRSGIRNQAVFALRRRSAARSLRVADGDDARGAGLRARPRHAPRARLQGGVHRWPLEHLAHEARPRCATGFRLCPSAAVPPRDRRDDRDFGRDEHRPEGR